MKKLITLCATTAMSIGLLAAPAAAAPNGAPGHGVLNKPRCEQVSVLGAGAQWSNDRGIKSCTVTVETRVLDISYELEQQLAQLGSLPGVQITVTQRGTLRLTLDVAAVLGASQRGNVGAPGTLDTLDPVAQVSFDLDAWWEDCRANVLTQAQTPPFWIFPAGPVETVSDVDLETPDEVCTVALVSSATGVPVVDLLELLGIEFELTDLV